MGDKVVISSTSVDSHGDKQSVELLKKGVESINSSSKMRMLINHRRDLPPLGYWDHAEVEERNTVSLLKAEPILYQKREIITSEKTTLIKESFDYPIAFTGRFYEQNELTTVTIDKNNFQSWDVVDYITKKLTEESNEPIVVNFDTRKNLLPEPRIIISLATYYSVIHPLIEPLIKKVGENIAEDFYKKSKEKLKTLLTSVRSYIRSVREESLPKEKEMITIFEIPGTPYIELHAKTNDADFIVKSLSGNRLSKVHKRIKELNQTLTLKEVHFKLNDKGQWKFIYLITDDGAIVGTKEIMNKRDYLHNRINLRPIKGYSMGSNVEYTDYEDLDELTSSDELLKADS